jgi:pimeloyl-ACP methyl ester carboxylesterase
VGEQYGDWMMFEEEKVDVGSLSINVGSGPANGPPLVLLHGVTRSWQDFAPVLASLSTRWHVHAIDFRGHGESDRAAGGYRVMDYVEDVVGFLKGRIEAPAVVFGHSLGGLVAAAIAAEAPERVRALILEDPPIAGLGKDIETTPFFGMFSAFATIVREGGSVDEIAAKLGEVVLIVGRDRKRVRLGDVRDATSLRFSAKCMTRLDPEVVETMVSGRWMEGYDVDRIWGAVRCPSLLLEADEDAGGMLRGDDGARAAGLLASCCHVRVEGVGHLIHWMATEETLRHVHGFLESV